MALVISILDYIPAGGSDGSFTFKEHRMFTFSDVKYTDIGLPDQWMHLPRDADNLLNMYLSNSGQIIRSCMNFLKSHEGHEGHEGDDDSCDVDPDHGLEIFLNRILDKHSVISVIYDDILLYGDVFNNVVSFMDTQDMMLSKLEDLIQELEKSYGVSITV
jgi:hypothetical protein